jgi:hypothetical protein
MADMDGALEVEMIGQRRDIGGVSVHLIAREGLAGPAMPAPVMGDHPEALGQEEEHLCIPVVAAERPAMVKHDRLGILGAPILVEDVRAVGGGDAAHVLTVLSGCIGLCWPARCECCNSREARGARHEAAAFDLQRTPGTLASLGLFSMVGIDLSPVGRFAPFRWCRRSLLSGIPSW